MTSPLQGRLAENRAQPRTVSVPPIETGLVATTVVLTGDGELPVEFLCEGDRILTRDAGMVRLKSLIRHEQTVDMVGIAAGSLGDMRPETDLVVPVGQRILIRDWRARALRGTGQAMIRADDLIDGEFVRALGPCRVVTHHLIFDRPHVIYAGGLELEADPQLWPAQKLAA